jgi:hypothetical protein
MKSAGFQAYEDEARVFGPAVLQIDGTNQRHFSWGIQNYPIWQFEFETSCCHRKSLYDQTEHLEENIRHNVAGRIPRRRRRGRHSTVL